jgi:hypothetical protein
MHMEVPIPTPDPTVLKKRQYVQDLLGLLGLLDAQFVNLSARYILNVGNSMHSCCILV